jgi:hypothetical protein
MHRTQPALSVEAAFLLAVEVSEDEVDGGESDFAPSFFGVWVAPLAEPLPGSLEDDPESPLSEVMDEDDAPRLSVL